MLSEKNLHKYQLKAYDFLQNSKSCALFMEMGLGKTITTLTYIARNPSKRYLIIAPLRVANTVWKQEAENWQHTKELDVAIATGTLKNRKKVIEERHQVTVINRENVPWLVENFPWKYDTVIIDESSSFKSPKSRRFKALKAVRKRIEKVILLTGTPSPNGLLDLWSQIYLIDQGERLGKYITHFREKYFRQDWSGFNWIIQDGSAKKIQDKIQDVCMTLRFQDYIDIPAAQYLKRYVELTSKQEKQYKELEKDFVLSLNATDSVEAFTSASLAGKLLQFCNGAIYDAEQKVIPVHDEKIQELKQVIEDNPDENFLIAYNYKHDLERLQKALPKAKTLSKSGEEIDAWNKEKIKYLLAHPASAGHGLNLQHGGNTIIWFGLNWNLELYEQFNARLYRQGQKDQVKIIHLVAKGCLDEKVLEALESKAKTQDDLKNYLKKTLH